MTEMEYREVETRLDEALAAFRESDQLLGPEERTIYESLLMARKELHGLRLELESEGVA